ncbi:zinc finger BED domain-containing protein 4-like [Haematobia irritans]|uniref:zinc finger BED domain-containing protein 4-like n=1 Tax=Haematobia irritans TaxID=7368 RepID=UPI003F4F3F6B
MEWDNNCSFRKRKCDVKQNRVSLCDLKKIFLTMPSVNPIWQFFERREDKAKCNICKSLLSLGSKIPKKQTVKNLRNHLERIHLNEYQKYLAIQSEGKKKITESAKTNQPSIKNAVEQMFTWPADSPITKRIDKCIMDLILVDMLPFNAVQGAAFQRLNFNDPLIKSRYKVKSEKFFRDLMHVTYDNVKKKIMDKVSKAKWISFTTDIWTSTGKTCSLLSFTAHFISEGKKEKVILGAADMSKNHKASYIFEKLSEIIKDFELEGRIHVGVSDNAGNMVAAMKLGDIKHFGCVSHTLQLAIHDAFNKNVQLKSLIEKCRKIVSHFKKSEKASRTFKSIQKECGLPDHRLLQDVSVRWNSSYIMMERLVEQSAAVNLYAAKYDGISVIYAEEWNHIKEMILLLESFYEATLDICSDDSCASLIIPLIQLIKGKIEGSKTILKNF